MKWVWEEKMYKTWDVFVFFLPWSALLYTAFVRFRKFKLAVDVLYRRASALG